MTDDDIITMTRAQLREVIAETARATVAAVREHQGHVIERVDAQIEHFDARIERLQRENDSLMQAFLARYTGANDSAH